MTDFDNAVYYTGDVAAAAAAPTVNSTRDDEVQLSHRFLPREAMLSAVFAVVVCLCVCV